jgi:uncharacterized protein (TIGR02266 family)
VVTPNPVRIRLRYADVDTFVEKFAPNVTRGGLFLASRNIQPVGELISFELQLVTGSVVLAGQGKVTWVKEFNEAEPTRPYGMGVQFVNVTPASRPILARILRSKDTNAPVPRGLTGMHATLVAVEKSGATNGKRVGPAVDTSVDLAAEYGITEATMQLVLDRRRRLAGRADDDLADLLRPDPPETLTLAQALSEMPRLLDPQNSRRRAAAGFRSPDSGGVVASETTSVSEGSGPAIASPEPTGPSAVMQPLPDDEHTGAIPIPLPREPSSRSVRSKRRRS